jgi:hypothetical protein
MTIIPKDLPKVGQIWANRNVEPWRDNSPFAKVVIKAVGASATPAGAYYVMVSYINLVGDIKSAAVYRFLDTYELLDAK